MKSFDFTPDPKVLLALTHTPMKPLDALCELIDNGIDSFASAKLQGIVVDHPSVTIELPSNSNISNGSGRLRVADNGPGMTDEEAEKAIKAGFSGNNPYDTLGLFGMGFNISTGKLGNRTTLMTAKADSDYFIRVVIDLNNINNTKNYTLPVYTERTGPNAVFKEGQCGTIIEVDDWWPKGNSNYGFVSKLIGYGRPTIRAQIGRRYATILRDSEIAITIDGQMCEPFEHCAWGSNRYVTRNGEQIEARIDIDKVLGSTRRCSHCTSIVASGEETCPSCGSREFRTIQEKVTGWVGIQRFDSTTDFGIDLIRNGRAIRIGEKDAFFTFYDELQQQVKDYPIDSPYGRIIGEIHIDSVPVDFMKTDFQRSSAEWQHAIEYLRGTTSLQPGKMGPEKNTSPIARLFHGYRKVRNVGRGDMYMGTWDAAAGKAKRISREVEQEYYAKFKAKIKGFYDDEEWWRLVETADQPPMPTVITCPECDNQISENDEVCGICGYVLLGKTCVNEECGQKIALSAFTCPHCGADQNPKILEPWNCDVCGTRNNANDETCIVCGYGKNKMNPLAPDVLLKNSSRDDDLSDKSLTIVFPDDTRSEPIDLEVFAVTNPMQDFLTKKTTPVILDKGIGSIRIFVDKSHPIFASCGIPVEEVIAAEVAKYLYDERSKDTGKPLHTISNLTWSVLDSKWADSLNKDKVSTTEAAKALLAEIQDKLQDALGTKLADYAESMENDQKKAMTSKMVDAHVPLENTGNLISSGAYIKFAPYDFLLTIFTIDPDAFFGGSVWQDAMSAGAASGFIDPSVISEANEKSRRRYRTCLENVVYMLTDQVDDRDYLEIVQASISYLQKGMAQ